MVQSLEVFSDFCSLGFQAKKNTNSVTDLANESDCFSQRYRQKDEKTECHFSHLRFKACNKYTLCKLCNLFAKWLPSKSIHLLSGWARLMQCHHLLCKPKWQESQEIRRGIDLYLHLGFGSIYEEGFGPISYALTIYKLSRVLYTLWHDSTIVLALTLWFSAGSHVSMF